MKLHTLLEWGLISLIVLLLASSIVSAGPAVRTGSDSYWRTATGNYYLPSGNIGIGTMNPTAKLQVENGNAVFMGNVGIGTASPENPFHLESTWADTNGPTLKMTSGNSLWFGIYRPLGTSNAILNATGNLILQSGSGNVGIGTNNPSYKLQVQGASFFSGGHLNVGNRGDGYAGIAMQGGGNYAHMYVDSSGRWYVHNQGTGDVFSILQNGNVGIGQINPGYTLEVGGTNANIVAKGGTGGAAGNYLGLFKGTGSLPTYPSDSYPTLKTDNAYLYFSAGEAYSAYMDSGGVWHVASSRSRKENFVPVNNQDILSKIDNLPMYQWNYKNQSSSNKHIAPIAEDFYNLFHIGDDNETISNIDPSGISLVGVKALSEKAASQQNEINLLKSELCKKDISYSWCK